MRGNPMRYILLHYQF